LDATCHDGDVAARPDPFPVRAPSLSRPVVLDQHWCDVTFIHWPVHPDSVAHMFPPGTRPDVFTGGMTYVALVPFEMKKTMVGTSLPLPYFGAFLETNVRLYSIDDAGEETHHGSSQQKSCEAARRCEE
jgi:uncharacterized protein